MLCSADDGPMHFVTGSQGIVELLTPCCSFSSTCITVQVSHPKQGPASLKSPRAIVCHSTTCKVDSNMWHSYTFLVHGDSLQEETNVDFSLLAKNVGKQSKSLKFFHSAVSPWARVVYEYHIQVRKRGVWVMFQSITEPTKLINRYWTWIGAYTRGLLCTKGELISIIEQFCESQCVSIFGRMQLLTCILVETLCINVLHDMALVFEKTILCHSIAEGVCEDDVAHSLPTV